MLKKMSKNIKTKLYNLMEKHKKIYSTLILTICAMTMPKLVYAAGQPKLVSGTVSLFQTATTWLLVIIPVGTGFFLGYHASQKAMSEDEAIVAQKNKLMKNVIIGAAIAESAAGFITTILAFYA